MSGPTAARGKAARPRTHSAGSARPPPRPRWVPPASGERTLDIQGKPSDPVNLYVHGKLEHLLRAFEGAGWIRAQENTPRNTLVYVGSVATAGALWAVGKLRHQEMRNAQVERNIRSFSVSKQTYNGRPMVVAFERDNRPLGGRHHFRVFDTGTDDERGHPVWAIAACRDVGLKINRNRPGQAFLDHAVEPNVDAEREEVLAALMDSGLVRESRVLNVGFAPHAEPRTYSADGRVIVTVLAAPEP